MSEETIAIGGVKIAQKAANVSVYSSHKFLLSPHQEALVEARRQQGIDRNIYSPTRKKSVFNLQHAYSLSQIMESSTIFSNVEQSIMLSSATLLSIELRNCGLTTAETFSVCISLRALNLAENSIKDIPSFSGCRRLQFIDLSYNRILELGHVLILQQEKKSILSANFMGNPIAAQSSYRNVFIARLRSLLVLDYSLVLTSERWGASL